LVFAETGGTFSLILRQASGSSCIAGAFFDEGGNGHNRQGFPGQRHPEHSASAAVAVAPARAAGIRQAIILNTLINLKFIFAFRTWLAYHRLIREFPQLQDSIPFMGASRINGADFEEDMLQQLRYILRRTA
jgi:hypothetical protein